MIITLSFLFQNIKPNYVHTKIIDGTHKKFFPFSNSICTCILLQVLEGEEKLNTVSENSLTINCSVNYFWDKQTIRKRLDSNKGDRK